MTYDEIIKDQLANVKEYVTDPINQEAKVRIEDKWPDPKFHYYYIYYRNYKRLPHDIAETMAEKTCK